MNDTALDYLKEVEVILDIFIAAYDFNVEMIKERGMSGKCAELAEFVTPDTINYAKMLLKETRVRIYHIEASNRRGSAQRMGGQNHQWRSRRGRL